MLLYINHLWSAADSRLPSEPQGFRGPVHVAELDATMWAAGNASACITQGTCLPLGGHSVWAALPPLPASGSDNRPILLVAAGVDSAAFFHDRTKVG